MRTNPTQIGRALADRLHRRRPAATTPAGVARPRIAGVPATRTARFRRFLGAARVTPYQLRRGWLW